MGPPAKLRREPWFRPANWLWQWFLTRYDLWAIPMPWRCVHVRRDVFIRRGVMTMLREHERVHYEQMEREGTIRWHVKYFWFLLLVGYRKNPYEIEAYRRFGG
jgi:hypothetical protein